MLFLFQCYAPRCLQIWATLSGDQKATLYCSHLKDAKEAAENKLTAKENYVSIQKLKSFNLKAEDMEVLQSVSSGENIKVYSAPGKNLVVPSLREKSHECPVPYVHLRDLKCPLNSCKDKQSKLHTLAKKEPVICLHSLLGKSS